MLCRFLLQENDFLLKLNQQGANGWDLVNIVPQVEGGFGNGCGQVRVACNILVFKKPK
jgi:hypothetical protein